MGLAFIPIYIKYLGIEAYGLIGLFAVLQAWLTLLDMGMTPTLGREMARFTGGGHSVQSIRDLLRSVECIALSVALFITLGIWAASGWLASDWLKAEKIPVSVAAQAFTIMGIVTALRFLEGIYRSCIMGLQQQPLFNAVNVVMATLRSLGAVFVIIWVSPTINVFFIWQGFVSVVTVIVLCKVTYKFIPCCKRKGQFSISALKSVWKFAGGMVAIAIVALILTGIDRILLSKLLTLSEYGRYTLAITLSSSLMMFIGPLISAVYPRMCELIEISDDVQLASLYHQSAQFVSVVAGSAAIIIALFAEPLLLLWTRDADIANQTASILSILVLVQLISGLMHVPHYAQLAYGWTTLELKIYSLAIIFIVPLVFWSAPRYGALGTSWVLLALGLGQLLIGLPFMFCRILKNEKYNWYVYDMILPIISAVITATLLRSIFIKLCSSSLSIQLLTIVITSFCTFFAAAMSASYTRIELLKYIFILIFCIRKRFF